MFSIAAIVIIYSSNLFDKIWSISGLIIKELSTALNKGVSVTKANHQLVGINDITLAAHECAISMYTTMLFSWEASCMLY